MNRKTPVEQNVLAVDIGNSFAKFGLLRQTAQGVQATSLSAVSLRRHRDVAGQLVMWAAGQTVDRCVIAGSNPPVLERLADDWPAVLPPPRVVDRTRNLPVTLNVDQPEAVGIDRVLNAFAAGRMYPQQNVIVVDSGTATTIDVVSPEGTFQGGTIFPGLRLSAYALHDYTARLPLVDVDATQEHEPPLPGRNTEQAIRAGLFWGQVGAIREIVRRIKSTSPAACTVILTGGALQQLEPHVDGAIAIESLALHGLAMLDEAPEST